MWKARIHGQPELLDLSVRESRAQRRFKKLTLEHGPGKVALIPPPEVSAKLAALHALKGKEPRRKEKH